MNIGQFTISEFCFFPCLLKISPEIIKYIQNFNTRFQFNFIADARKYMKTGNNK